MTHGLSRADWALIISIIGAATGVVALVRDGLLRRNLRKAALAPILRPQLEILRDSLNHLIEAEGMEPSEVTRRLVPPQRRIQESSRGLKDRKLRTTIDDLQESLTGVFENAPTRPRTGSTAKFDEESPQRLQRHIKAAREAESHANEALSRLSELVP